MQDSRWPPLPASSPFPLSPSGLAMPDPSLFPARAKKAAPQGLGIYAFFCRLPHPTDLSTWPACSPLRVLTYMAHFQGDCRRTSYIKLCHLYFQHFLPSSRFSLFFKAFMTLQHSVFYFYLIPYLSSSVRCKLYENTAFDCCAHYGMCLEQSLAERRQYQ